MFETQTETYAKTYIYIIAWVSGKGKKKMNYEEINRDLMMKKCNITDLTLGQAQNFLKQWEEGATIDTLTVYCEKDGMVVLNADHPYYETLKSFVEAYLSADEESRAAAGIPEGMEETARVLDKAVELRKVYKGVDMNILGFGQKTLPYEEVERIADAVKQYHHFSSVNFWMQKMFQFGYVYGKRAERAR